MRTAVILLFLAQLMLTIVAAHASPDYSGRSSESVLAWAFSGGLWGLVESWLITVALTVLWCKAPSCWTRAATLVSLAISLVWVLAPRLISLLGDGLFFRFP